MIVKRVREMRVEYQRGRLSFGGFRFLFKETPSQLGLKLRAEGTRAEMYKDEKT